MTESLGYETLETLCIGFVKIVLYFQ